MIPLSSKDVDAFEFQGVTYKIRPATKLQRAAFRREVSALGATWYSDDDILQTIRDGINERLVPEQRGEWLETVNSYEYEKGKLADLGEDATEEERESFAELADRLAELESWLKGEYTIYAERMASREYWLSIASIVAFKHFVIGWSGEGMPDFQSRGGQVCPALIDRLEDNVVVTVGWRAVALMSPNKEQEKNSDSQSQLPLDPPTSTADGSHQTADQGGKSAA